MVRVAVIGCGYWGPNLIRNFSSCPDTQLLAVCDRDAPRVEAMRALYPAVEGTTSIDDVLGRKDIDAVAIATPVGTHAPIYSAALRAGKHVLMEKPMSFSLSEARDLVQLAERSNLVLMLDHTFVYSEPVRRMKEILDAGELGDLYFIDSVRINLGLLQHEINVVWDLAPHDLSIMDFLLGRSPRSLSAFGTAHANSLNDIEDVAYVNLDFGKNLLGSLHLNWLSPVKIRYLILGGSKKSIVYNDLEPTEKLKVYDRSISVKEDPAARHGILIGYRTGDVWSPHLGQTEPLQTMVRHFAECVREGKRPLTDGQAGLRVVRILEAAQRSIKAQGGRITLGESG